MHKLSIVSYLNSLPFAYGAEKCLSKENFSIQYNNPADCAKMLVENKVDIGLVPTAVYLKHENLHRITNYCIGSFKEVYSVVILSNSKIEDINTLILDYQSRTSVELTKVLLKNHFKLFPELKKGKPGYEENLIDKEAALIIGDRPFKYRKQYNYCYDLSLEWYKMTSLPFVFAVWVSNKELSKTVIDKINKAFSYGIERIPEVVKLSDKKNLISDNDLESYLIQNISYTIDNQKLEAINTFKQLISQGL